MTSKIAIWKEELREHRQWWIGLALALTGGILAVLFGFAGNYPAMGVFATMLIIGLWLR